MKIFKWLGGMKKSLTTIGNKEPLNFFSILLLIALDIYVIINIFWGLDTQVAQLTRPTEKVPYRCIDIVESDIGEYNGEYKKGSYVSIVKRWSEDNDNSFYENRNYKINSYNQINEINNKKIIQECKEIYSAIVSVGKDNWIDDKFYKIKILEEKQSYNKAFIEGRLKNYDTNLLEKIAGQSDEKSITKSNADIIKEEIEKHVEENKVIDVEISKIENSILNRKSVKDAIKVIDKNKSEVKKKLDGYKFWYPLQKYGVRLIFILPLFLLFWFLYKKSSRKDASIFSLIYAHLLVISSIPIILGLFEMIFKILPRNYFDQFLKFLEALNIGGLLNYIFILIGIIITMFVIYIVQKKLFNKQKVRMKRISKGKCPYCSFNVENTDLYCYHCGELQKVQCSNCHNFTHKEGQNCTICGVDNFKNRES